MLSPVRNHAGSAARFLRRADAESQVQLAQVEDLRVPITTTCTTTFVTERKQSVGVAHALVLCHTHFQTGWGTPAWHSLCQACAVVCTHLAAIVSTSATAISSRLVMLQFGRSNHRIDVHLACFKAQKCRIEVGTRRPQTMRVRS